MNIYFIKIQWAFFGIKELGLINHKKASLIIKKGSTLRGLTLGYDHSTHTCFKKSASAHLFAQRGCGIEDVHPSLYLPRDLYLIQHILMPKGRERSHLCPRWYPSSQYCPSFAISIIHQPFISYPRVYKKGGVVNLNCSHWVTGCWPMVRREGENFRSFY